VIDVFTCCIVSSLAVTVSCQSVAKGGQDMR
jgi:hypothetical protein